MASILNSSSSIFRVGTYHDTYDLTTQEGRSNFWDYILSVIPETNYPGIVATRWDSLDQIYIKLPNNNTYLITGEGQIWLHGCVGTNTSGWSCISLCLIDAVSGNIIILRLAHAGNADIYLHYSVHYGD